MAHANLGGVLSKQDKWREAEAEHRSALEIFIEVMGAEHPHVAGERAAVAGNLLATGEQLDEARALAQAAWDRCEGHDDVAPHRRAEIAFVLARVLWPSEADRPRALTMARLALKEFTELGSAFAKNQEDIERWLAAREDAKHPPPGAPRPPSEPG